MTIKMLICLRLKLFTTLFCKIQLEVKWKTKIFLWVFQQLFPWEVTHKVYNGSRWSKMASAWSKWSQKVIQTDMEIVPSKPSTARVTFWPEHTLFFCHKCCKWGNFSWFTFTSLGKVSLGNVTQAGKFYPTWVKLNKHGNLSQAVPNVVQYKERIRRQAIGVLRILS